MKLRIFTDGACSGNPGPGGWAILFNLQTKNKTVSGNKENTTNNIMELTAVTVALELAFEHYVSQGYDEIEIHSDSAYVINAVNLDWLSKWKSNGWLTVKKEEVKNKELWERLYAIWASHKNMITFIKVKGHAGNTFNEIVDKLAVEEWTKIKN